MELGKKEIRPKTGKEKFIGSEADLILLHFWQWAYSDILNNATRGVLAEFVVASAFGLKVTQIREDWAPYDLITESGISIEVKSSAYIQSWSQKRLSSINFSIRETFIWNDELNSYAEKRRQADVYVFCLLKHKDKFTVDPLNLEQWSFYVVPTPLLNNRFSGKKSISIAALKLISDPISYTDLKVNIEQLTKSL